MVSRKKRTFKRNLSFLISLSFLLVLFSTGTQAEGIDVSLNPEILDNAYLWILSFGSIISPNNPVYGDGIALWSMLTTTGGQPTNVDKKTQKDKTDKTVIKDHKNSTSRKPPNGDD